MIELRIPESVARFMYSVILHFLTHGNLKAFAPRVTSKLKKELVELQDILVFEISTRSM